MVNDDRRWVREQLQLLDHGSHQDPDLEAVLARIRTRAAERPLHSRWFAVQALRWAAALVTLCFVLIAASTIRASAERASAVYRVEVDQAHVGIRTDGSEEVWGRRWLRIRSDGAHVITQSLARPFLFITVTRIVSPDGHVEKFFDLIPIPIGHGQEVPGRDKVAAGCVLPGSRNRVVGRESLHGYETVIARSTVRGGQITTWLAPELGCEELQSRVEVTEPDGSLRPVFAMRTLSVRRQ